MNARLIALLAVAAEAADDPPAPVVVARRRVWVWVIVAGGSTGNTTFNVRSYRTGNSLTAVIKLSSDMFQFFSVCVLLILLALPPPRF